MTIVAIVALFVLVIFWRRLKGKRGEKQVAALLAFLPKDNYKVINDLLIQSGGHSTQIDHVVISVYGVFVIETKYYQGWIFGGRDSEYWTQNIYGNKYRLLNPLWQNQRHIKTIARVIGDSGDVPLYNIIAFSRQATIKVDRSLPVMYWWNVVPYIKCHKEVHLSEAIKHKKQVVLKQYESAHSNESKDRVVEPIDFTANMIDIWAYDVENGDNRVFKIQRIHSVEVMDADWAFQSRHKAIKPDVFRMTGALDEKIALQLNTRAKSLLLEEFPLAEKDLKREDGKWFLRTTIHSLEGAGRFVIGLAADIKIVEGEKLREYILDYQKHIAKL